MPELMSPARMQEYNSYIILQVIKTAGEISRADIARILNCSKSAVSAITRKLEDDNLIVNAGRGNPHTGRKSRLICFNEKAHYILSLRLLNSSFQIALVNLNGNVSHFDEIPYPGNEQETIINLIIEQAKELLHDVRNKGCPVKYAGVTIPGIVDSDKGRVLFSSNLNWNEPVYLAYELESALGLPVFLENDANAQALAESWCGEAGDYDDYLYLFIGEKIGGACIHKKSIVHGKNWTSAELGKFLIPSRNGVLVRIEDHFPSASPEERLKSLGHLISSLVITYDPEAFILQGQFMDGDSLSLDDLEKAAREYLPPSPDRNIRLKKSFMKSKDKMAGGAAAALSKSPYQFIIGTEE